MGPISFERLKGLVEAGEIDTVLACIVDMQGRLMGKRFHARHFVEHAWRESHCCNYLLATDLEMNTVEGFRSAGWAKGYGDYTMRPDLGAIRLVAWRPKSAIVLCDVIDHDTENETAHSPRALLKKQVAGWAGENLSPMMATELEFFLFEGTYEDIRASEFRNLRPVSDYNEDYHILQTTKEERVMRPLRNALYEAGVPVEGSKGEAAAGQEELNIAYGPALLCADHHVLAKLAVKEIAWAEGCSASFLAKWRSDLSGNSSHVHISLANENADNAFFDEAGQGGMSMLMRRFLAGLIRYGPDLTYFLAPYINSYKRFVEGAFAPTVFGWSVDNRTAAFRVCGAGTKSVRIECRIPGGDINPYLAQAALLAAGRAGVAASLALPEPLDGDNYQAAAGERIPKTLRAAVERLQSSEMLREAFGPDVVDHYARAGAWEQEKFDRAVTDYELFQGFEQA